MCGREVEEGGGSVRSRISPKGLVSLVWRKPDKWFTNQGSTVFREQQPFRVQSQGSLNSPWKGSGSRNFSSSFLNEVTEVENPP